MAALSYRNSMGGIVESSAKLVAQAEEEREIMQVGLDMFAIIFAVGIFGYCYRYCYFLLLLLVLLLLKVCHGQRRRREIMQV